MYNLVKNRSVYKFDKIFWLFLILYLSLGLILIDHYQYFNYNDSISYISIAKLYLSGDYAYAINGYWSPLYSLLLIPFLKIFGISPINALYSARILNLIIGLFTLIGIRLLSSKFELNNTLKNIVILSIIPLILYLALTAVMPDLLFASLLVYYFNIIFDKHYPQKLSYGLLCGIIGGLAFLAKAYGFPFFIASFALFNILHYLRDISAKEKRMIVRNIVLGFTIFFMISAFWIVTISEKYGEFTYSTSATYNYNAQSPNFSGHPTISPQTGFIRPPYAKASNAWEDPSYIKFQSWSPLDSLDSFIFECKNILNNSLKLINIYNSYSPFSWMIILFYIIISILPINKLINTTEILFPLLTVLIFPLGYIFSVIDIRYFWIIFILLVLMAAYLLKSFFKSDFFTKKRKIILTTILVVSFMIMPINNLILLYDADKQLFELTNRVDSYFPIEGNIASNGDYFKSVHISYLLGTRYYGFAKEGISDQELQKELNDFDIDYYFVWQDLQTNTQFLDEHYMEVTNGKINGLRIYSIKKTGNLTH